MHFQNFAIFLPALHPSPFSASPLLCRRLTWLRASSKTASVYWYLICCTFFDLNLPKNPRNLHATVDRSKWYYVSQSFFGEYEYDCKRFLLQALFHRGLFQVVCSNSYICCFVFRSYKTLKLLFAYFCLVSLLTKEALILFLFINIMRCFVCFHSFLGIGHYVVNVGKWTHLCSIFVRLKWW